MNCIDITYIKKIYNEIEHYIQITNEICKKEFDNLSEIEILALRYCIILIAESISLILMHIARCLLRKFKDRRAIETPVHASKILQNYKILTQNEVLEVENFIKLRNIVVHRYWEVDDYKIYINVRKNFRKLKEILEKIVSYVEREVIQD